MDILSITLRPVAESVPRNFTILSSKGGFAENKMLGSSFIGNNFGQSLKSYPLSGHIGITLELEVRVYIWGQYGNIYQGVGIGNKSSNQSGWDLILEGSSKPTISPFNKSHTKEVQLGLGGLSYYADPVLANALYLENRGWQEEGNTAGYGFDTHQFDQNGYPKYLNTDASGNHKVLYAQPGQNSNDESDVYYRGRTTLTWEGDADIRITSATCISGNCTGSLVNGTRVYTISGSANTNGYLTKIYSINPSNYPKKIRIWMPDPSDPFNKSLTPING